MTSTLICVCCEELWNPIEGEYKLHRENRLRFCIVCETEKVFSERKASEKGGYLPEESIQICSNHDDCETRRDNIKMTKGFIAKEPVKGHMVNVVKGLKLYEDIFTDSELSRFRNYINDLRHAGHSGELSGDTFILFNQQLKRNKRELIQLGVPIFGEIRDEKTKSENSNIEPIPSVLQAVIDNLSQGHLIPESRKPNSCIINFFDEGEYYQPFLKPPHLDQPIATPLLSENTQSLLVMRGNNADIAKHVICASENRRVSMTFFKVRTNMNHIQQSTIPPVHFGNQVCHNLIEFKMVMDPWK
ncbi:hypothetical protein MKX03_007444 [Papaver bracteatum]|nr:hypothetical protein MKX03_007444 [Papaver bracteatum]